MDENNLIERLVGTEARSKSNTKRLDSMEAKQAELGGLVAAMSAVQTEQKHIKEDVSEIKSDVKTLTEKPAKRWDAVITAIIGAVVGILIGLLFKGV